MFKRKRKNQPVKTRKIETRRGTAPEFRHFRATEIRADGDGDEQSITGYATIWDSPSVDMGFTEFVRKGAFTKTLKDNEQYSLWSHDASMPLASTENETLELKEDDKGLWFRAVPNPDTSWGRDALASIARGDVRHMSFGFFATKTEIDEEENTRALLEVELFEVSPVVFPAYPATEVEARDRVLFIEADKKFTAARTEAIREELRRVLPEDVRVCILEAGLHVRSLRELLDGEVDLIDDDDDGSGGSRDNNGPPVVGDPELEQVRAAMNARERELGVSLRLRGVKL